MAKKHNTKVDWGRVRDYYVTHDESLSQVAVKFDLSSETIRQHSRKEGWMALKEKNASSPPATKSKNTKTPNKPAMQTTDLTFDELVSLLERKTMSSMEILADDAPAYLLKDYSIVLKNIRELRGEKSDLDKKEQMARIERLQRETEKLTISGETGLNITINSDKDVGV